MNDDCYDTDDAVVDCLIVVLLPRPVERVRPQGERSCESFCCVNNDNSPNRCSLKRAF